MTDYDIGRLTSAELTEVRTVLSRAETALASLKRDGATARLEIEPMRGHFENVGEPRPLRLAYGRSTTYQSRVWVVDSPAVNIPHPDIAEMRDALQTTVNVLRKWERTGPKKRSK